MFRPCLCVFGFGLKFGNERTWFEESSRYGCFAFGDQDQLSSGYVIQTWWVLARNFSRNKDECGWNTLDLFQSTCIYINIYYINIYIYVVENMIYIEPDWCNMFAKKIHTWYRYIHICTTYEDIAYICIDDSMMMVIKELLIFLPENPCYEVHESSSSAFRRSCFVIRKHLDFVTM